MLAGCAPGRPVTPTSAGQTDPNAVVWRYEVSAAGKACDVLTVEARFAPGSLDDLEIDADGAPFVRELAYAAGSSWVPVEGRDGSWMVPCRRSGCTVRYRFALAEAAAHLDSVEGAIASGDVISAPPSTWLLHPSFEGNPVGRFRLHVTAEAPSRFTIAMPPSKDDAATFEAGTEVLEGAGFAVFGPFRGGMVSSPGARVEVAIAPHGLALSDADIIAWVRRAVDGLASYYGHFPAPRVLVVVMAGRPGSPTRGETLGDGGPAVLVRVGSEVTTAASTRDDWIVTHELIHATLPTLDRDHAWLSEGLATYVEPIVRARQGLVTPETYWHDVIEGVAQGLPEAGDEGLERTHTWGRTYWGGALFCLVADVRIREMTKGARSLDGALRGIAATGADASAHWTIEQFLDVGDRATGTTVLRDLYKTMGLAPGSVDLPELWRKLGVHIEARGKAGFDDAAPLAAMRKAMTAP
jgi:hypothetical protein